MKNQLLFLLLTTVSLSFFACANAPEGDKAETADATEVTTDANMDGVNVYEVNTDASQIAWNASKVGGQHNGTIAISGGTLQVKENQLVGGEFVIDATKITVLDLEGENKMKLEGHLSSGDFFEAETYPTGSFVITSVDVAEGNEEGITHHVTGNLTLKGTTKSVKLPAMVSIQDGGIQAKTAAFTINRTEWGINYGSGVIGTAKDKIIHDEVGLNISLMATAKM